MTLSLTAPSSAEVVTLHTATTKFEAWRESWARTVLADRELGHAPKLVACFIIWYLNRQSRDCFPSFQTIADGIGVDRSTAIRAVAKLKAHGYLHRRSRGAGRSNLYSPAGQVVAPLPLGGGTTATSASGATATLTSLVEPPNLTLKDKVQFGLPRKQGWQETEAEKKRRWVAEGKSEFTGQPIWTRPANGRGRPS